MTRAQPTHAGAAHGPTPEALAEVSQDAHRSRISRPSSGAARRAARTQAIRRRRADDGLLEAARVAAEEAARARPELLSLLSHDLRNPLSIMTLGLHSLSRHVAADHPARRHVDSLRRAADELGSMLENTSEAARADRGEVPLQVAPEPLPEIVEAACAAAGVQRIAHDRQIAIAREIGAGVGAVVCSRDKLVRVLCDLLGRAVRLSPKKSTVTVRAERGEPGAVRIAVVDSGAAIPGRYRDMVFDMPHDDAQRRATGQAFVLDLFAARGVIAAQGGTIELEDVASGGNAFVITLPDV